jgi:hypothetical protein
MIARFWHFARKAEFNEISGNRKGLQMSMAQFKVLRGIVHNKAVCDWDNDIRFTTVKLITHSVSLLDGLNCLASSAFIILQNERFLLKLQEYSVNLFWPVI